MSRWRRMGRWQLVWWRPSCWTIVLRGQSVTFWRSWQFGPLEIRHWNVSS